MEITQRKRAGKRKMSISGEMSIYEAMELKDGLLSALEDVQTLEINLSQVSEIDTVGFQMLALAKREAERENKTLQLVEHSEATRDVIDTFRMAEYFGDPIVIPAGSDKN